MRGDGGEYLTKALGRQRRQGDTAAGVDHVFVLAVHRRQAAEKSFRVNSPAGDTGGEEQEVEGYALHGSCPSLRLCTVFSSMLRSRRSSSASSCVRRMFRQYCR